MDKRYVKRYSLAQQVADQLQKMIEKGVWEVGEKIPTEPELTDMFAVSRNTLREAIRCLTSEGILVVKQGDGTYVRANNGFRARMSMAYDQVSLSDIREARNMIQRREKQAKEGTQADIQFHMAIAKAAHNQILEDLYGSLACYLENHITSRSAKTNMNSEEINTLHEELFNAILQQDEEQAERCAQNVLKI